MTRVTLMYPEREIASDTMVPTSAKNREMKLQIFKRSNFKPSPTTNL